MKLVSILKPAAMLTLFCVVITALLAGTNLITKNKIAELEKKANEEAMKIICEAEEYKSSKTDDGEYYEAVSGGKTLCYIFTKSSSGYGGQVKAMTGITPDGKIKSVQVLDVSSETAGLGQKAKDDSFVSQFNGKVNGVSVVKYGAQGNEVNAVTGATISSRGVTACVSDALAHFEKINKEAE